MASHGLTDLTATVNTPKSEYEELIRTSEQMRTIKRILEQVDDDAPCVLLKTVLGIEGGKDETENDMHVTNDSIPKYGEGGEF